MSLKNFQSNPPFIPSDVVPLMGKDGIQFECVMRPPSTHQLIVGTVINRDHD